MLRQKALLGKRIFNKRSSICQDDAMYLNLITVYDIESIKKKLTKLQGKIDKVHKPMADLTPIYQ